VNWAVVRQIERAFEDEGFDAADEDDAPSAAGWYGPGARRGTFDRYTYTVDWADPRDVRRVLNVFEQALTWIADEHEDRGRLVNHLRRDGYEVDEHGCIRAGSVSALAELPLGALSDPAAIREHLDRIADATDRDPVLAISGAKALIEATAKLTLHELGQPVDERADVPALVKAAQKALGLHPEVLAPDAKGADVIKRTLSGLSQIAISVAELRNLYGSDHGRSRPVTGLGPRHAHLAVGASATYCRMLLETLDARRHHGAPPPAV
jgi:Abortive infection C-terminus